MTQPDSIPVCGICQDEEWVCENHPNEAWPSLCQCGAGMPCPNCNSPPKELRPIKQTTDSILSAEELDEFAYQIHTCVEEGHDEKAIEKIKTRDQAMRNSALEEAAMHLKFMAIYNPMGTEATKDICQRLSMAIASLKTPSKEGT